MTRQLYRYSKTFNKLSHLALHFVASVDLLCELYNKHLKLLRGPFTLTKYCTLKYQKNSATLYCKGTQKSIFIYLMPVTNQDPIKNAVFEPVAAVGQWTVIPATEKPRHLLHIHIIQYYII